MSTTGDEVSIEPITIDFETNKIEPRPRFPPEPVGVAIKWPGMKAKYHAWGHPQDNTCDKEYGVRKLKEAWTSGKPLLFHNSKFDVAVANERLGLSIPSWEMMHDTMFLLFLDNPYSKSLALKPSSEIYLGMPPEERDMVCDWLVENQAMLRSTGLLDKHERITDGNFGKYISLAPGGLVAAYGMGDVIRTEKLFKRLYHQVTVERGMRYAYDTERELMPILLANEREGIRAAKKSLANSIVTYEEAMQEVDEWIRKRLHAPGMNVNADQQLANALESSGVVTDFVYTKPSKAHPNGQRSVSKDNLTIERFKDPRVFRVLTYRNKLAYSLATFMRPWAAVAEQTGGTIHTNWNQVMRQGAGAITGRMSSSPNFQNVTKNVKEDVESEGGYRHPSFLKWLPELPSLRRFLLPDAGELFGHRDFCFSDDTEVLTDEGWKLFKDLTRKEKVAQWRDGVVSFAHPLAYQNLRHDGVMYHITGKDSFDLLVSPNHRCLVELDGARGFEFVRPADYPTSHAWQWSAGKYLGTGKLICPTDDEITLLCALQADGSVKNYAAPRVVWYLKKPRKIERLSATLKALGVDYFTNPNIPSKPGFTSFSMAWSDLPSNVRKLIDREKTFTRKLLSMDLASRRVFVNELFFWDGSRQDGANSGYYCSTNRANVELVQEVATLSNYRAQLRIEKHATKKTCYFVNMRDNPRTGVDTAVRSEIEYHGRIYCVSMPHGTVIVRRNGRVSVTGNCQQELRILAEYEGRALFRAYRKNADLDVHVMVQGLLADAGQHLERSDVKRFNFGILYGMGATGLSKRLGISKGKARELISTWNRVMPGVADLVEDIKDEVRRGGYICTWGGRQYTMPPPMTFGENGEVRDRDYVLLNYLIQGSGADATKRALINYYKEKKHSRIINNVHDEINFSAHAHHMAEEQSILKQVIEDLPFDVGMKSDGKAGKNWGALEPWKDEL
jgi:DNA polymerase I-like protein with 3'-5' exonuclease and polymerase domains